MLIQKNEGGGNGIGAATLQYLCEAGARVVFGDYDNAAGEKVAKSFSDAATAPLFVHMDASKYADNIRLFRTALDSFGRVDHAIACAGIIERGRWFDPELTIESVEKPETTQTIDINFLGVVGTPGHEPSLREHLAVISVRQVLTYTLCYFRRTSLVLRSCI